MGGGDRRDHLDPGLQAGPSPGRTGPADPVRRCAGHQPHNDLGIRGSESRQVRHDRISGPPDACCNATRTAPSAWTRSARARSRLTPVRAMTIAVFTSPPARPSQARASSGEQSTAWAIIHTALTASFALRGCTSTIRLLYTLPNRTIVAIVSMLQTNFCAVPAFIRVEPVSTSGPTPA